MKKTLTREELKSLFYGETINQILGENDSIETIKFLNLIDYTMLLDVITTDVIGLTSRELKMLSIYAVESIFHLIPDDYFESCLNYVEIAKEFVKECKFKSDYVSFKEDTDGIRFSPNSFSKTAVHSREACLIWNKEIESIRSQVQECFKYCIYYHEKQKNIRLYHRIQAFLFKISI